MLQLKHTQTTNTYLFIIYEAKLPTAWPYTTFIYLSTFVELNYLTYTNAFNLFTLISFQRRRVPHQLNDNILRLRPARDILRGRVRRIGRIHSDSHLAVIRTALPNSDAAT